MKLTVTGANPLIMHNVRLADESDPYTKAIAAINAKRKNKTDDDQGEVDRLSFAGALYHDDVLGPYLPAPNIFRSLINAARITRAGKTIERGLVMLGDRAELLYDGPRDIEGLWGGGQSRFVDRRMVVVNMGKKVPRTRPVFPEWQAVFEFELDPEVLDFDDFVAVAVRAGRMEGVGDYRRFYGRFHAEITS